MSTSKQKRVAEKNSEYVRIAERYGCRPGIGRLIVEWARYYGLPISVAFAMFDKESNFRNVFGHDPTRSIPRSWMGGAVTKTRYRYYKTKRKLGFGMQGVGAGQLTWYETQDLADRLGGCHKSGPNIRVAIMTMAARIKENGYVTGVARYNGSGPAAEAYSRDLREKARLWHRRLAS